MSHDYTFEAEETSSGTLGRWAAFVFGAALGAFALYLFDPTMGGPRRAKLREQGTRAAKRGFKIAAMRSRQSLSRLRAGAADASASSAIH